MDAAYRLWAYATVFAISGSAIFWRMTIRPLVSNQTACEYCYCLGDGEAFSVCCTSRRLWGVPKGIPNNVTSLDLSNTGLSRLHNDSFYGLSNLRKLDLSQNPFQKIEIGTFWPLKNLEELRLVEANLFLLHIVLKNGIFRGLTGVRTLKLYGNVAESLLDVYRLPDEAFAELTGLEDLSIDGPEGVQFGPGFHNLTNFIRLTMSGWDGYCKIVKLQAETFFYSRRLRHISITKCGLKGIDPDAFKFLTDLETLNLSENEVVGPYLEGLRHTQLSILNLTSFASPYGIGSALTAHDARFLNQTRLEEIYMDKSALEVIETGVFNSLPQTTKKLYLRQNRLSFGLFMRDIPTLTNLIIFNAGDQSEHILNDSNTNPYYKYRPKSRGHSARKHIIALDKTNNEHKTYDKNLGTSVGPADNRRTDVSTPSNSLPQNSDRSDISTSDETSANEKVVIPSNSSDLNASFVKINRTHLSLTTLICTGSGSNLVLPDFSDTENDITYIDISRNQIAKIDNFSLVGLSRLQYLNLSTNQMFLLEPMSFTPLHSLRNLDISHNRLRESIHENSKVNYFSGLHDIEVLNISQNLIVSFPRDLFRSLSRLQILDASSNELEQFNVSLTGTFSLRHLDLSNNHLLFLPSEITDFLDNLTNVRNISIDLSGNNLLCTCATLPFLKWLKGTSVTLVNVGRYFCSTEASSLRSISDPTLIKDIEHGCKSYTEVYVSAAVIGTLIVTCISSILIYKYRWKLQYLYYMAKFTSCQNHALPHSAYVSDGYVSYDENDLAFLNNYMLNEMENCRNCKLILKDRDFMPGKVFAADIVNSIRGSRKTILLLSRSSRRNTWMEYEMQMALLESIYTSREVIIVVMIENISSTEMPPCIKTIRDIPCIRMQYPDEKQAQAAFWNTLETHLKEG